MVLMAAPPEEYKLSFRIRRIWYDQIARGDKLNEIRRCCEFWDKRVKRAKMVMEAGGKVTAVLVSGKDKMSKPVHHISHHQDAFEVLGREPSEQGKKDLGQFDVWAFWFNG